jgi:hypothetical protein
MDNKEREITSGHPYYIGMFTDLGNIYIKEGLDSIISENKYGVPAGAVYDFLDNTYSKYNDLKEAGDTDVREHAFAYVRKNSKILVPEN